MHAATENEPASLAASVSVVVPTYREAANIPVLTERVRAALDASMEWELLFVDDDSGDGSEEFIAKLARHLPVRLVTRRARPRDLSLSVLLGLESATFNRVVVMDADLSHPPERIIDLLVALDGDCDMAIGSRYAPGGVVDQGWSRWRRIGSRAATALARPLVGCSDPLSGFFALDRRALPDLDDMRPVGFKIALELMVRGKLVAREVPIHFRDRDLGASKMGWRQQVSFLRHLYRLYTHRHGDLMRLASFGIVGVSGFVVDLAFYLGLQWVGIEHRLARFLAFWPAVTWNWLLNRRLTFRDRIPEGQARQWTKFVAGSLAGLVVNVGSYTALTTFIGVFETRRLVALVVGVGVGALVNFLLATNYVYRRRNATSVAGSGDRP